MGNSSVSIQITCKNNTVNEIRVRTELDFLIRKYNLKNYFFTDVVIINESADYPHSHPVLSLNTRHFGKENILLSTFIHEQIHWFAVQHFHRIKLAIEELKIIYPKVPVGYPNGARDEFSTYLHIIINWLELNALSVFLEKSEYEEVVNFLQRDHYRWIYHIVVSDHDVIKEILGKYEIQLDKSKGEIDSGK
ncbi:hypothetical protein CN378_04460 [Bacillus sp. AFS015802]|uniref:hypothetical protein n=1 Tax=Bacillus sp. AFS015802 TaxID=2033486 RepID=UPI000BF73EC3|nr:hypothetical protein [Bacillus sp. AFS015802]PFA69138.1 hypothetical protein CN378_04460 [Bacillus sp. AFS015802]